MKRLSGGILVAILILGGSAAKAGAQQSPTPNSPAAADAEKNAASAQAPAATSPAPGASTAAPGTAAPAAAGTGLNHNDPFVVVASVARQLVKKRMALSYPADAVAQGITGVVKLEFLVSRDGSVIGVRKVSGPQPLLDAAAKGMFAAQYEPMTLDGKPVYMASTIRVEFVLDKTKTPPTPGARELVGIEEDAQDAAQIKADQPFAKRDPNAAPDVEHKLPMDQVTWNVKPAKMIKHVDPDYPDVLKREGVQGTVVLHAIIRKDGTLGDITFVSGPPQLKLSAIDAVKQWRYEPTLLAEDPVEVDTSIKVVYQLGSRPN
jgi:TonB family protein